MQQSCFTKFIRQTEQPASTTESVCPCLKKQMVPQADLKNWNFEAHLKTWVILSPKQATSLFAFAAAGLLQNSHVIKGQLPARPNTVYIYMYICFAFAQEPERRGRKTGTSWKGGRRVESMAGIALGGWLRHRLGGWGAGMVRPGLGAPVVCLWREGRCRKKERGKEVL